MSFKNSVDVFECNWFFLFFICDGDGGMMNVKFWDKIIWIDLVDGDYCIVCCYVLVWLRFFIIENI